MPLVRRDSKDQASSGLEPISARRDSKDKSCSSSDPIPLIRKDSKERCFSNGELIPRKDGKDRGGGHAIEFSQRQESKDRDKLIDQQHEPLSKQDSKERARNGLDSKQDSRDRVGELLPRQESKDRTRNGPEFRHDCKDNRTDLLLHQESVDRERSSTEHKYEGRIDQPPEMLLRQETSRSNKVDFKYEGRDRNCHNGGDLPPPLLPRQESKDLSRTGLEVRRDSKDRSLNGSEQHLYDFKCSKSPPATEYRCDKERGHRSDGTPRHNNRANHNMDQSKAQERSGSTTSGQHSSTTTPTHHGKSSGSPPLSAGTGNGESLHLNSKNLKLCSG